ncbi:MAG: AMP-binding protein [Desulfobacterales bacterium]|jgi:acyl-CoA synthetase (AMP-forming)/AMP-acid ligase II|nr:AMP-binding protein [Desulfobacteraceae bacterium]MBT7086593.1 AMP-binding protein [Desulfobacterales bacterium]MBT7697120.1 AMP-binding protein [Desulfobacterales bacterium]
MIKRYIDLVSGNAKSNPESIAVIADGVRLTFSELDMRIGRLGSALRNAGLKTGARVALLAANELEYVEIQAACLRSGFTMVPLNIRLALPELAFIIDDSEPAIIIGGRNQHERVKELALSNSVQKVIGLGETDDIESYGDFISRATPDPDADPLDPDIVCTILYTSGTTGRPKGAVIDRLGLTARVFVNSFELESSSNDIFVAFLPMFHISAYLVYASLFSGGTVVMPPEFTPESCVEILEREKATSMVLVPTMIRMLIDSPAVENFDPSNLRLIVYGGESIPPAVLKRAVDKFQCGFHQQYGMTETGGQSVLRCADHITDDYEILGSAGKDAVTFEVRVVDDNDKDVQEGEPGEVVCRGPAVMTEYWRRPDATEETLKNGWMHTGDIGLRDKNGYLHIIDRRNDMILSGGENIYPREVEQILMGHPQVSEATVIGLPDPKWGEVVTCILVGETPEEKELEEYLRKHIAGYKLPRKWFRLDELPRNAAGKVLKNILREQL